MTLNDEQTLHIYEDTERALQHAQWLEDKAISLLQEVSQLKREICVIQNMTSPRPKKRRLR